MALALLDGRRLRGAGRAALSALLPGDSVFVWYDGDDVYHERLLLWPVRDELWVVRPPDDAVYLEALDGGDAGAGELTGYAEAFRKSWVHGELHAARNVRPAFKWGLLAGSLNAGIDQMLFRGKAPWTLKHGHADHETLRKKSEATPIDYPKPDGEISFDRLTNVSFSATNHEEDQPVHLMLTDETVPISINLAEYDAPEQRYCPAGVYEILEDDGGEPRLQINAQNCVHCKTCDIKDPTQNITWITPEGGGGPNYPNM